MAITPAQCRAARGLVDMDQAALADRAMVTRNVIIDFEKAGRAAEEEEVARDSSATRHA